MALMVDPRGDQEIVEAQQQMKATLEDWIPKILAAQEPDGYLQTVFTLSDRPSTGHPGIAAITKAMWPATSWKRPSAHYMLTGGQDKRLYDAAKKLADCWDDNIGPPPKKEWYDGHQAMEIGPGALRPVREQVEGDGQGDKYIAAGQIPARLPHGRQPVRSEPRAGHPAVRSGRPRGARRPTTTPAWPMWPWKPATSTTRAPSCRCGTISSTASTTSPAASAAARRRKALAPTTRCGTTPIASPVPVAERSSSSTNCT